MKFTRVISIFLFVSAFLFSGCTSVVIRTARGKVADTSFIPSAVLLAETLPNGDLQLFTKGNMRKDGKEADFALVISVKELDATRAKSIKSIGQTRGPAWLRATRNDARLPGGVPVPVEMLADWRNIRAGGGPVVQVATLEHSENKKPSRDRCVIYYTEPLADRREMVARVFVSKKPAPAYYALLPVAIAGDIGAVPFVFVLYLGVTLVK
jgi:hypothetical protein